MIASLILAAQLTGTAPVTAAPLLHIENGQIVQVSPRPAAGSGVFAIYADFEVVPPDGERRRMYVLWMGGRQFLPEVGSVCAITYRREPLARGNLHNPPARIGQPEGPLNVVYELSCGPPLALPRSVPDRPGASLDSFGAPLLPGLFERARVIRVSPRPGMVSGIFLVTTDFDVEVPGGTRHNMTMLYGSPDQFIPPPGSICRIRFDAGRVFPGTSVIGENRVQELACDTGRFSMNDPVQPVRVENARVTRVSAGRGQRVRGVRYLDFDIEAPGRELGRMYLPVRRDGPGLPRVGDICAVAFDYSIDGPGEHSRVRSVMVPVVSELSCEAS